MRVIIILLAAILLTGCTTPLQIKLTANKHLNLDAANHSLPVQVIVYQLRDEEEFQEATFTELWQNDREVLDGSLLNRREVNIAPGAKKTVNIDRNKETNYIGIIAIFRNPQSGHWRAIKKIGRGVPLTKKEIQVELQNNRVRIH